MPGPSISKISPTANVASDACVKLAVVPDALNTAVAKDEPFCLKVKVVEPVAAAFSYAKGIRGISRKHRGSIEFIVK